MPVAHPTPARDLTEPARQAPHTTAVAYLGPPGSFTEAALAQLDIAPEEAVPYPNVRATIHAVRTGHATAAVIPWENSVEGSVTESIDALTTTPDLTIVGETHLHVQFALGVPEDHTRTAIQHILTHPIAHAQCRTWLNTHQPQADIITTGSTAQAAKHVSDLTQPGQAAIAAPKTLTRYGLHILHTNIADYPNATTRFIKITRTTPHTPPTTGHDRTTLHLPHHNLSQLPPVLQHFTQHRIPLTTLQTRPTGHQLGTYHYLLECEGHHQDPRLNTVLTTLTTRHHAHILGSYPRHTPTIA